MSEHVWQERFVREGGTGYQIGCANRAIIGPGENPVITLPDAPGFRKAKVCKHCGETDDRIVCST